jgi:hypothetical protein
MKNVFDGAPVALVKQLLNTTQLKEADLAEIKALIEKMEKR